MVLPAWFIIGAAKSGTTSLHKLAVQHPSIEGGVEKEPRYFVKNHDRGLEWYEAQFAQCRPDSLIVDGSVENTLVRFGHDNPAVDRIADLRPAAKLVFIARHPIDRVVSNFRYLQHVGSEHWQSAPRWPRLMEKHAWNVPTLLDRSRYWWHLAQYRRRFRDDQILALTHDELASDQQRVMDRLYDFLEVPRIEHPVAVRANVSPGPRVTAVDLFGHATVRGMREELREDARRYLEYAGATADLWDMSP